MNKTAGPLLSEKTFEDWLPKELREKSKRFFTPEQVAIPAARWLTGEDKRKVLDIGAGIGKFCIFGARHTHCEFVGIELRPELVEIANKAFNHFNVPNVRIVQGNITDFQFSGFSAFYFYNPFQENLVPHLRMDDSILLAHDLYYTYMQHTCLQLTAAPVGVRLATFHANSFDIPLSFECVDTNENQDLKFWIKRS